jgi:hypothetical protein
MVSVPTQGASRAVIQAVCNGGIARCAAPSSSCALLRDLSSIVHLQRKTQGRVSQCISRSRRGFVTMAVEGNGASAASTGLSIDLRGAASNCCHLQALTEEGMNLEYRLICHPCRQKSVHRWRCRRPGKYIHLHDAPSMAWVVNSTDGTSHTAPNVFTSICGWYLVFAVQGFGWAIAKALAEAGAEISLGVWVSQLPLLSVVLGCTAVWTLRNCTGNVFKSNRHPLLSGVPTCRYPH